MPTEDDGIVPAHEAIAAPTAKAPAGPEDGSTSSASTRIAAPRQTLSKPAADIEAPAAKAPPATARGNGEPTNFGLGAEEDDDDDFDIGLGEHAVKAFPKASRK